MAQIHLHYEPGSCNLAPHALMCHLSIPFISHPYSSYDTPPSDEDERKRRLYELCRQPPSLQLGMDSVRQIFITMPAVLTYIASRGRDPQQLLGTDEFEKAMVAEWLAFLDGRLHRRAFLMVSAPRRFIVAGNGDHNAIAARGRRYIEQYFTNIDGYLSSRNFAVGERFTVVEFYLYVFARWYDTLYGNLVTRFPEYYRVMRSTESLPGVMAALGEQELEPLF
jgi:glutathione S-transferase